MKKAELREVQDTAYGILVEFDRVCRKYDIKYSMEGGTLLGAVKYGDFVPWDDDIDVIMLRGEYEKFLKIAPTELQQPYFLQSYQNIPSFPLNYAKLCYTKSKIYDYSYSQLEQMNHGIFIDIFPIDYVEPKKMQEQIHMIGLLTGARKKKLHLELQGVPRWKRLCYAVVSCLPMGVLCFLIDKTCKKYNCRTTGFCYEICNPNKNFVPLPSSIYQEYTTLLFRDREFLAVSRYDDFLRTRFGCQYMNTLPPEDQRKPSHCQNILIER